jgi:hypothetical protein
MRARELAQIKKTAEEKYDGDLDVAIAEHLYGEAVIIKCAGKVPSGCDHDRIAEIRAEIEATGKKKPAAPPKTSVRSRSARKPAAKKKAAAKPDENAKRRKAAAARRAAADKAEKQKAGK